MSVPFSSQSDYSIHLYMAAFFQGTVALGILVMSHPEGADEMGTDQVTQLPHDQEAMVLRGHPSLLYYTQCSNDRHEVKGH